MSLRALAMLALVAIAPGCLEAEARPEVVVFVDMDMLLVSQLSETKSQAALFDTLRIEVLDVDRKVVDLRQVAIGSPADLPFSFGIAGSPGDVVHVRLRAFRSALATPGQSEAASSVDPVAVLDPAREVTVDRVLTVTMPEAGVEQVNATLRGECVGLPPKFGVDVITSCLDETQRASPSIEGIGQGSKAKSEAGTWWRAEAVPCEATAPAGTRCVPGGLSLIGDPLFVARQEFEFDALPARMIWLPPMFMDETEMTMGMLRDLGDYDGRLPDPKDPADPTDRFCSNDPSSDDGLPLNCLDKETAIALCAARGGTVPTEAQWDHAARGRGRGRLFPWGDEQPECCTAAFGQAAPAVCQGDGPPLAGTHRGGEGCIGDVSLDGVLDLAGSMSELTRDLVGDYDAPCWHPTDSGIAENPSCDGDDLSIARGASWLLPLADLPLPIRRSFSSSDPSYGFRCVFVEAQ